MPVLIAIALIGLAAWYCTRPRGARRNLRAGRNDKDALGRWENEGGATSSHSSQHP